MSSNPKLPLTDEEKLKLRKAKIKLRDVAALSIEQLVQVLEVSRERARSIKGLAEFQSVPSIGNKLAEKLVDHLHMYSLEDIKYKDGAALLDELEQQLGVWTDSCVEDQIRCVIHYANDPSCTKQWFDFTEERKQYRETVGYPANRPQKAWYE
ncbi:Pathogenicity locus [Ornithinibacillus sp. L9]|uniref:Pathogenicity locus n=1 Tax=Ornithinibacillus caprae TaxID=2678566 RepID=A0A6N8FEH2_9BACI|nr:helix-hairpin-helix domain-containing protein [Ornithinibacillus caprae]MUK87940.1 Pathogenicity locus [Ornithinibacillus caprae]